MCSDKFVLSMSLCLLLTGCCTQDYHPCENLRASGFDFSPDGTRIAIEYGDALCIVRSDTLQLVNELDQNESNSLLLSHAWAPDGASILVLQNTPEKGAGGASTERYNFSILSTPPIPSSASSFAPPLRHLSSLSLSGDGSKFAYVFITPALSFEAEATRTVRVVSLRDNKTILETSSQRDTLVSYSPKSRYLVKETTDYFGTKEFTFLSLPGYETAANITDMQVTGLTWSRDGTMAVALNSTFMSPSNILIMYSFNEENTSFMPLYWYEINVTSLTGYDGHAIEFSFSPDNRYIAISGIYLVSACPSDPTGPCSKGFVAVIDLKSKKFVFHDVGGELTRDNWVYFDWAPDGRLAYLFSGESFKKLRFVSPSDFSG